MNEIVNEAGIFFVSDTVRDVTGGQVDYHVWLKGLQIRAKQPFTRDAIIWGLLHD